jgi:hypothetical protein
MIRKKPNRKNHGGGNFCARNCAAKRQAVAILFGVFMPQQSSAAASDNHKRRRSGSWLDRKLRRFRDSRRAQKNLQQLIVIIAAVLIAFILGFYFLGPSFSS